MTGWFRTGDIGRVDEDGYLIITDRKKELLKTAAGKFVAPAPIENMLKTSPYITNAIVVGDKRKFVSGADRGEFGWNRSGSQKAGARFCDRSRRRFPIWWVRDFDIA